MPSSSRRTNSSAAWTRFVNNAGVMLLGPIAEAPLEEWERMVAVNVMGLLYCTHAALPHLLASAG